MSDNEKSKLNMYETVISYCQENRDIISNIRSFAWSLTRLRKMIDEIKRKDKELSSETLEKTILTYKAKDELIFELVPVVSALFSFARENNNISLKEKTRFSQSYYVRLRDHELFEKSSAIHSLALRNVAKMKKFNISLKSLQNLKSKIDLFKNALDNKIVTFVSSDAVLSMNGLFTEADKILNNNLDSYVEVLSEQYEEFYDEYLTIRSMENEEDFENATIDYEEEEE